MRRAVIRLLSEGDRGFGPLQGFARKQRAVSNPLSPNGRQSSVPLADRGYLLRILTSDDLTRAGTIGDLYATGLTPAAVELLNDVEADRALQALLVGILRAS
jgi:hypothetical protein